ncbi:phosphoribosylformylglycinamidine synthase subunit PurS [Microscilla marina]|uniref:Phosphoribosylformylglycinamidine synthase subunit PurS n=1 Tax=Microscilla marina ATCC 23134 TaxID=313606 RepID=A1ZKV9_MICM2|nr:phosphoribosylformylglycinamidine synthase subunit PurS [Microscilla marina]EAY28925.1 phosphoribosylformylglycinamidine synthase, PurS protein [Microscilla marina ATCC 23134]
MKFQAEIDIMPRTEILDPQGKAVKLGLGNLGINNVNDIRVGKHIVMNLEAENLEEAKQKTETACKKLLANMIVEEYTYKINLEI